METWLTDMDGVLVHEEVPIPGAVEFLDALRSRPSVPRADEQLDLHPARPAGPAAGSGLDVPEGAIWTSALATAQFLADQRPEGRPTSSARPA